MYPFYIIIIFILQLLLQFTRAGVELTHEVMVIRQCAMKTMDSQCGKFKYQEHTMNGCILTCDFDGCNSGHDRKPNAMLHVGLSALLLALTSYYIDTTIECFQFT